MSYFLLSLFGYACMAPSCFGDKKAPREPRGALRCVGGMDLSAYGISSRRGTGPRMDMDIGMAAHALCRATRGLVAALRGRAFMTSIVPQPFTLYLAPQKT